MNRSTAAKSFSPGLLSTPLQTSRASGLTFLTASAATRAKRRFEEFGSAGEQVEFNEILASIEQRDKVDTLRTDSPLRPADDADVIETDDMSLEEVVARVMELATEMKS